MAVSGSGRTSSAYEQVEQQNTPSLGNQVRGLFVSHVHPAPEGWKATSGAGLTRLVSKREL